MNDDISHILKNWDYNPEEDITVRLIDGDDGTKKIQMRIDMGLIQMELDGNPTGEVVEEYESWLEYYENSQKQYEYSKVDDYFSLNSEDCKKLRREGIQYYYRYLSLTKLEDYERVVHDTERNLRLFAFVKKYAASEMDRWALDQFRPYVIMMYTRARTSIILRKGAHTGIEKAIEYCNSGIEKIIDFYKEYDISSEMDNSIELSILKALKSEFLKNKPESLEEKLQIAIREERFEDAVKIRDKMRGERERNKRDKA